MFRSFLIWLRRTPLDAAELAKAELEQEDNGWPATVAIDPDSHHAQHVGTLPDGRQFFLTTPFVPASGDQPGCEFVALYIFDDQGHLLDATIDNFGAREGVDGNARKAIYEQRLEGLGNVRFERIEIEPFCVDKYGEHFGLIVRTPEDEEDVWAIEAQPGNYMAFFEPWDSGDYDT